MDLTPADVLRGFSDNDKMTIAKAGRMLMEGEAPGEFIEAETFSDHHFRRIAVASRDYAKAHGWRAPRT